MARETFFLYILKYLLLTTSRCIGSVLSFVGLWIIISVLGVCQLSISHVACISYVSRGVIFFFNNTVPELPNHTD